MQDIDEMFKIGDTVVAWFQIPEPYPIDMEWQPPFYRRRDVRNAKIFLYHQDRLVILSKALTAPDYYCYIFKVQDKDGRQYYLSSMLLQPEPIQLSFPF